MSDLEKIIRSLECCCNDKPYYHDHCDECDYNGRKPDNMGGCTQLQRDALTLLKEQESKKTEYIWECPNCGSQLIIKTSKVSRAIGVCLAVCPICGNKVLYSKVN